MWGGCGAVPYSRCDYVKEKRVGLAGNGIVIFNKVLCPPLFWSAGSEEATRLRGIASAGSVATKAPPHSDERNGRSGKGAEPDGLGYASARATFVPVLHG